MEAPSSQTGVNISLKQFAAEFLSFLERHEEQLLSWGFYDGSFTTEEIADLFFSDAPVELQQQLEILSKKGSTLSEVVEQMAYDGLLFQLPGEERFRTRFAEGVRLLARLRQLFPWHKDWTNASPLVSHIRIHLSSRRYPLRDASWAQCWQEMANACAPGSRPLLSAAMKALATDAKGQLITFAAFQKRAFSHVFSHYRGQGCTGSVVSAGTGAGKTKAFYVPVFLRVLEEIAGREPDSTRVIAIYPRNVLLADQLREALSEAGKMRPICTQFGLPRGITFGALLGDTPHAADFSQMLQGSGWRKWKRSGEGFVVPYVKHPGRPECDLVWRDSDREARRTCLFAADRPNELVIPDGVLRLTREQLQAHPPDVLFLSAEMLNREMGNPDWSRTFGVGQGDRAPRILLLDEVHSYSGIQGAQIAWLIRRWRYWTRAKRLHVVGLSATLRNASRHLADVAGLSEADVSELRPGSSELTDEGMEYNLVVKGDPYSGASLLATTIQTGMLLARLLAPKSAPQAGENDLHSNAFYGRKVFGFTDNLDTLNRWLHDMTDAERRGLAKLRKPSGNVSAKKLSTMRNAGQVWDLPIRLNHDLYRQLAVSGCSSQRPGVNSASDVIIATSSLEVGFDDPEVGVVLHHKRPTSMASFVQRRGRAGRRRGMRPWTVVVLSDYGADRHAFQNAEKLFQPDIEALTLPLENPFVLRLQATYMLLDWLGLRVKRGGPFQYLKRSGDPVSKDLAKDLLTGILNQQNAWESFYASFGRVFSWIRSGSKLSTVQLDDILWHEPRPLLAEVIPTLLRKVETEWTRFRGPSTTDRDQEDAGANRPLPAHLPAATFSQIDVAEVTIRFPTDAGKAEESLALHQALMEICPGRVSKRFAIRSEEEGYWLAISNRVHSSGGGDIVLRADECFTEALSGISVGDVDIFQPLAVDLARRPSGVANSSNATWNWMTKISSIGDGRALPIPELGIWKSAVVDCRVLQHRDRCHAEVTRFASTAEYTISEQNRRLRGKVTLRANNDNGRLQAVGFRKSVDAIRMTISGQHLASLPKASPDDILRLRADYFREAVYNHPALQIKLERFALEALATSSLAMLSATAVLNDTTLQTSQLLLQNRPAAAKRVFDTLVGSGEGAGDDTARNNVNSVCSAWADADVVQTMNALEAHLWNEPGEEYTTWLKQRYLATMAQAFRTACVAKANDVSEDDLTVDVVHRGDDVDIYLLETASGGVGFVERIISHWMDTPQSIPAGVAYALATCPHQAALEAVSSVLDHVAGKDSTDTVTAAFARFRAASDFRELRKSIENLRAANLEAGLDASRRSLVPVVSRLLLPGSSPASDLLAHQLRLKYQRVVRHLGIQIDSRIFAYVCVNNPSLREMIADVLGNIGGNLNPDPSQFFSTVEHFVQEPCFDSCRQCLNDHNRYNDAGSPSRALARSWFNTDPPRIAFDLSPDWLQRMTTVLQEAGAACITVEEDQRSAAMPIITSLLAVEVEVDFLLLPIRLASVSRAGRSWRITLELSGYLHA